MKGRYFVLVAHSICVLLCFSEWLIRGNYDTIYLMAYLEAPWAAGFRVLEESIDRIAGYENRFFVQYALALIVGGALYHWVSIALWRVIDWGYAKWGRWLSVLDESDVPPEQGKG